ncbi:hypothetical protein DFH11DRAFT_1234030 [Phellopilus nigrolimitatus]|nr:hypothetical protein DFH11DRAFT_1234030 [Phellopilus nigrolimitatus]
MWLALTSIALTSEVRGPRARSFTHGLGVHLLMEPLTTCMWSILRPSTFRLGIVKSWTSSISGSYSHTKSTKTNDYQRHIRTMPTSSDHPASLPVTPSSMGEAGSIRHEIDSKGFLIQAATGTLSEATRLNVFYDIPGISAGQNLYTNLLDNNGARELSAPPPDQASTTAHTVTNHPLNSVAHAQRFDSTSSGALAPARLSTGALEMLDVNRALATEDERQREQARVYYERLEEHIHKRELAILAKKRDEVYRRLAELEEAMAKREREGSVSGSSVSSGDSEMGDVDVYARQLQGASSISAGSLDDIAGDDMDADEDMDEDGPRARTPTQRMFSTANPTLASASHMLASSTRCTRRAVSEDPSEIIECDAQGNPLPSAESSTRDHHNQQAQPLQLQSHGSSQLEREKSVSVMTNLSGITTETVSSTPHFSRQQIRPAFERETSVGAMTDLSGMTTETVSSTPHYHQQVQTAVQPGLERDVQTDFSGLSTKKALSRRSESAEPRDFDFEHPDTQAQVEARMKEMREDAKNRGLFPPQTLHPFPTQNEFPHPHSVSFRDTTPQAGPSRSVPLEEASGPSRRAAQLATLEMTPTRRSVTSSCPRPPTPRRQVRPSIEMRLTRARAREDMGAAMRTRSAVRRARRGGF